MSSPAHPLPLFNACLSPCLRSKPSPSPRDHASHNCSTSTSPTHSHSLLPLPWTLRSKPKSLAPLAYLTQLQHLNIGRCNDAANDLAPLAHLPLTFLDLSYCGTAALHPLASLGSLRRLRLTGCASLTAVGALGACTALREIALDGCTALRDVSALGTTTQLTHLQVRGTAVGVLQTCNVSATARRPLPTPNLCMPSAYRLTAATRC